MKEKNIILVANRGFAIWNSRSQLIKKIMSKGYSVIVLTAKDEYGTKLEKICTKVIYIDIKRGGFSLGNDIHLYRTIRKVYQKYKPVLVQLYNAKPVMLGSYLAKDIPASSNVVSTITGLGYAFENSFALQKVAGLLYRYSLKHCDAVVFQNKDDKGLFIKKNFIPLNKAKSITGSGVDIEKFSFQKKDHDKPSIYFIGRLLWQKGIKEFIKVAQKVRSENNCSFHIVGELEEDHPNAVPKDYLQKYEELGVIKYHGYQSDMVAVYQQADILLFPSFYREGIPRVVLEASSSGVVPVGYDVPGVRESIINGVTGVLVKKGDVDELTKKVSKLVGSSSLSLEYAVNGRKFIEKKFSINHITNQYLELYKKLGLEL